MQCAQNVWRKRAFAQLARRHAEFGNEQQTLQPGGASGGDSSAAGLVAFDGAASPNARIAASLPVREALAVFREHVERDVSNTVPLQSVSSARVTWKGAWSPERTSKTRENFEPRISDEPRTGFRPL